MLFWSQWLQQDILQAFQICCCCPPRNRRSLSPSRLWRYKLSTHPVTSWHLLHSSQRHALETTGDRLTQALMIEAMWDADVTNNEDSPNTSPSSASSSPATILLSIISTFHVYIPNALDAHTILVGNRHHPISCSYVKYGFIMATQTQSATSNREKAMDQNMTVVPQDLEGCRPQWHHFLGTGSPQNDCMMTSDLEGMTVKSLYFLWPSADWCRGTCPSFEFYQDKGTAACVHVDCASPLFQQPGQVFPRSPVDGCASNLDKTIPLRPLNPEVGNLEEHLSDVDIKSYLWV